ncbi:hypothetical protein JYU34_014851 [Plutella xylostella]|uniref:Uncharacterized protein n=1 Tax=Plutella xylostella TaxID=51655 RepID=A0ABQ7Q746_PLUXY|nr:hypothetical protein JYU34_014851 [Plutella xylostella]
MDKRHNNVLNIVQWNSQSLRPKLLEFENFLIQDKIHIAIISESWLEPGSDLRLSGYSIYRQDREDSFGGVAILIHNSVRSHLGSICSPNTGIQLLFVKLLNCELIQGIVGVYCPSSVHTVQTDWDYIFSSFNHKTLIVGDFNGQHSSWAAKTDSRGSQLYDAMLDNNYISLNDGSPTRLKMVSGHLQKSSPDISFITTETSWKFHWKVLNESLGSDHLIIKMSSSLNESPTCELRRNFKKADWLGYSKTLQRDFEEMTISEDPQLDYDIFIKLINNAADSCIPIIKLCNNPQRKFVSKPYWNQELSKAVAERRLALAKLRANPTPDNLGILQQKISSAQKLIRKAKSKSWQEFCSSLDSTTSSAEMWRRMRWLKGYKAPKFHIDGEQASKLLHSLSPDFVSPDRPSFNSSNSILSSNISKPELERAIKNKDTAPGDDGITFSMIKNMPDIGKSILLNIYNRCLTNSFVPRQWRRVKIVAIPKSSLGVRSTDVRPIALMSCPCKIFHSILNHRLEWYLERQKTFSPYTVGFRKCHSCADSLSRLVSSIQLGFSKKEFTLGCFIDIENAYNNVDVYVLVNILDKLGIGESICRYLFDFLIERHLYVRANSQDSSPEYRSAGRGLAQGDPMSPLLFNVATAHFCKNITNVFISQYADDFVLYATNNELADITEKIQTALNALAILIQELGLQISCTKTKLCLFTRGFRRYQVQVHLNNVPLQLVDSVKYLGLWLDRSLRWGRHINEISQKTVNFLNLFKVLAGSGWGMHPKGLRRLYISIIRSRLDYSCFLYDSSVKSHLVKLDKIQNQAMRVIGGFIKSTPIHVMESELCLQPLQVRRRYLGSKFWLKSRSLLGNTNISLLEELSNSCNSNNQRYWVNKKWPVLVTIHDCLQAIPMHSSNELEMFLMDTWTKSIDTSDFILFSIDNLTTKRGQSTDVMLKVTDEFINNKYRNFYRIYTDASRDENGIGAAFLDITKMESRKFKITSKISIMFAELFAISEAVKYVKNIDSVNIVILSDSRSALQHVARCTSNVRGAPIAYSILDTLVKLRRNFNRNIVIQWIPSHIGETGNEQVDALAKQAVTSGDERECEPFYTDLLVDVKTQCYNLWKEHFDERSLTKGIWYKTLQSSPPRIPWFDRCAMERQELVTAMRTRSGHIPTNKFAFLMKKSPHSLCSECGVEEDLLHVLRDCVRNEAVRASLYDNHIFREVGGCNLALTIPWSDEARSLYKLVKVALKNR